MEVKDIQDFLILFVAALIAAVGMGLLNKTGVVGNLAV